MVLDDYATILWIVRRGLPWSHTVRALYLSVSRQKGMRRNPASPEYEAQNASTLKLSLSLASQKGREEGSKGASYCNPYILTSHDSGASQGFLCLDCSITVGLKYTVIPIL